MEEILDVFDIKGNYMGSKPRSYCHGENPGVYHKVVWIWIVNSKNEILVQKRSALKKKSPNKWDMPAAGHVASGESVINTCIRETNEELGLNVKKEDFIFLKELTIQSGWELAQIYLLKIDVDISNIKLQKEEVEEIKWLSFEEFKKLLYSPDFCNHSKEYKDWVCEILKR